MATVLWVIPATTYRSIAIVMSTEVALTLFTWIVLGYMVLGLQSTSMRFVQVEQATGTSRGFFGEDCSVWETEVPATTTKETAAMSPDRHGNHSDEYCLPANMVFSHSLPRINGLAGHYSSPQSQALPGNPESSP